MKLIGSADQLMIREPDDRRGFRRLMSDRHRRLRSLLAVAVILVRETEMGIVFMSAVSGGRSCVRHELPTAEEAEIVVAQELIWEVAGHRDAEVTVAVGTMLIDVCAVSYRAERDKIVLHVLADDIADAVRDLALKGLSRARTDGRCTGLPE